MVKLLDLMLMIIVIKSPLISQKKIYNQENRLNSKKYLSPENYQNLPKNNITEESNFLNPNARAIFNYLQLVLTKTLII